MPRTGGVYTPPAGTKGTPNTTVQSAPYNAFVDDLASDANGARPLSAGGTGATNATDARTNLGADNADNLTKGTVADARLPGTMANKTFTGLASFRNGSFAAGSGDVFRVIPSDWGSGKPGLYISQTPNSARWNIGFWDGSSAGGAVFSINVPDPINGFRVNESKVWHAGNDGAGSGLDADLLDGESGSYYTNITARLGYTPFNKAGDTFTGNITWDYAAGEKNFTLCQNTYLYGAATSGGVTGLFNTTYGGIWSWNNITAQLAFHPNTVISGFAVTTSERIGAHFAAIGINTIGSIGHMLNLSASVFGPGNMTAGANLAFAASGGAREVPTVPGGSWICLGYCQAAGGGANSVTLWKRYA